jgi:hypothetical protein
MPRCKPLMRNARDADTVPHKNHSTTFDRNR